MRSDIAQGNGAYKSTDGGRTWSHIGLADTQQIGRIVVDPRDPDRVFLAALGHPYGPNAERGVFRSTDGGKSWQKVLFKDADTGAIDIAFRPGDPSVIYAALWQTRRPPWSVYPPSNGPAAASTSPPTAARRGRRSRAAASPRGPATSASRWLQAAPTASTRWSTRPKAACIAPTTRARAWTRASGDRRIWGRGWYFGNVAVEPRDPDTGLRRSTGLYRSRDAGKTFVPDQRRAGGDDYQDLWIDPEHPERRMLGVDQGAVVSLSGGETWSSWYNQPIGQMYHVITDQRFPYWVYGAQQDSGAAGVPSRTTDHRRHQHDELPRGHRGRARAT
jgi:hypothetical protein